MKDMYNELANVIKSAMGINITSDKFDHLEKAIAQASKELDIKNDFKLWIAGLIGLERDLYIKTLAKYITIGETYFFREEETMQFFQQTIVEEIQNRRKDKKNIPYRIWCPGCSTGEEPYSIAILLHSTLKDLKLNEVKILATDINVNAIEKAKKGIYREWSFRTTPLDIKEKYFCKIGNEYELSQEIKSFVTFKFHNLISELFPCETNTSEEKDFFDLIICRNVFIYFDKNTIDSVVKKFSQCLHEYGWFITSQTELSEDYLNYFTKVSFKNSCFYRKSKFLSLEKNLETSGYLEKKKGFQQRNSSNKHTSTSLFNHQNTPDGIKTSISTKNSPKSAVANPGQNINKTNQEINQSDNLFSTSDVFLKAIEFGESGDHESKEKLLKELLFFDPNHLLARYEYANCLFKKNKIEEAQKQLLILLKKLDSMSDNVVIDNWVTVGCLKFLCNHLIKLMCHD